MSEASLKSRMELPAQESKTKTCMNCGHAAHPNVICNEVLNPSMGVLEDYLCECSESVTSDDQRTDSDYEESL